MDPTPPLSRCFLKIDARAVVNVINSQPPTTVTCSLPQTREKFYFGPPSGTMDICLYRHDHTLPAAHVTQAVGLTPELGEI